MLCPTYPICSFKNSNAEVMSTLADYLFLWNLLNYPAGVLPIAQVLPEEENYEDGINDKMTRIIKNSLRGGTGMPVSI